MTEALGISAQAGLGIVRRVYQNLAMVAVEVILLPRIRPRLAEYVQLDSSSQKLLQTIREEGKGAVFFTGHIGNWELLAQRIALEEGIQAATFARPSPNPYLGNWLVERRSQGQLTTINRGDPKSGRLMLQTLKAGGLLGALIDQDTKVPSVFVPFFGKQAKTPVGPAQLAVRRQMPVLLGFIRRLPEGGHSLHLERLESANYLGEEGAEALTAAVTLQIEAAIREVPDSWVWFHKRWKSQPEIVNPPATKEMAESTPDPV